MSIVRKGVGAFVNGTGGITPVAPSFSATDAVLVITGEFLGSDTIAAPGGIYTELSSNTNVHQLRAFGFISTTGAEAMPTFNWSASVSAWAIALVYTGVDPALSTGTAPSDRTFTHASNIVCPAVAKTPIVDGCLCVYFGHKNKTSTSNASTFSPPTNFNIAAQQTRAGTSTAAAIAEWIQGTATTIASGQSIVGSVADGTAQAAASGLFILQPAAIVLAPPSSGGIFVNP